MDKGENPFRWLRPTERWRGRKLGYLGEERVERNRTMALPWQHCQGVTMDDNCAGPRSHKMVGMVQALSESSHPRCADIIQAMLLTDAAHCWDAPRSPAGPSSSPEHYYPKSRPPLSGFDNNAMFCINAAPILDRSTLSRSIDRTFGVIEAKPFHISFDSGLSWGGDLNSPTSILKPQAELGTRVLWFNLLILMAE